VCFQLAVLSREVEAFGTRLGFWPVNDPRSLVQAGRGFDLARLDNLELPFGVPAPYGESLALLLEDCKYCVHGLSDELSRRFFMHAGERTQASVTG
jgi:hypothetical protein